MRLAILLLALVGLISPWIIYRRNQKKKLLCREEHDWGGNATLPVEPVEVTSLPESRKKRDIPIDPVHKEPIIYLGNRPPNTSEFIDDGDFDIVSEHLSEEELAEVKKQIMQTCNALDRERQHTAQSLNKTKPKPTK